MGFSLNPFGKRLDQIGGAVGNFFGGVSRQINPFDHGATFSNPNPQPSPSPAPAPMPRPQIAAQVGQQFGFGPNATPQVPMPRPAPIEAPKINLGLEANKQFLGGMASDAYHGVVDPLMRGGRALTSLQNTGQLGESGLQFAGDVAQTGMNFAGPVGKIGTTLARPIGALAMGRLRAPAQIASMARTIAENDHPGLPAPAATEPLGLPAHATNPNMTPGGGVIVDPNAPAARVVQNAGKAQVIPTKVSVRPGVVPKRVGVLDSSNNRMAASDVIPGKPAALVTEPGQNLSDIHAPRASGNPARVETAGRRLAGEPAPVAPTAQSQTNLTDLITKATKQATGEGRVTTREQIGNFNDIIEHTDATPETKTWAINQRDALLTRGGQPKIDVKTKAPAAETPPTEAPPPRAKPFTETDRRNTGLNNPVKIEGFDTVAQGDHAKAISNKQRAKELVDKAAGVALKSSRKLSAHDDALMPRVIEDPSLISGAERPDLLARAIHDEKVAKDTAHAVNQTLKGEPTAYIPNHATHDWNLPPEMTQNNPESFKAVNEMGRTHPTIAHGEANGLTLKTRRYSDAQAEYYQRAGNILGKQALKKGLSEADAGATLTHSFDTGGGNAIKVSAAAKRALQGSERQAERSGLTKAYDTTTKGLKQTLLSLTQFHPINIGRKAGAALVGTGHPVKAVQGVRDMFLSISKHYAENLERGYHARGTYDNAARIGTPMGTSSDYSVGGQFGKHGLGEKMIFERQMPAMHGRMVEAAVKDLKRRNVSLDSPEARQLGTRINEIMGFVNTEVRGLDARTQRGLGRILLAPQFTRSKWATIKGVATDQGLARQYAIAAVVGDTAAVAGTMMAVGHLLGQKQDSLRDTLIRALVHPSIPTPFKDEKGNNIELGLPSSYISEAFGLVGSLERGKDGHLHVSLNPGKIPGNLANYGRARLNIPWADALKAATNTDFANKPLYNPTADLKTKVVQAATTLGVGNLPIPLQAAARSDTVTQHLPAAASQILNASKPKLGAAGQMVASALGATPRTDKTTGKGLETANYFGTRDDFAKTLDPAEKNLFNKIDQAKKDSFGNTIKEKTTLTRVSDYQDLLANPDFNGKYSSYMKSQDNHDPLWDLPDAARRAYMQASVISKNDPGGDPTTTSALYKKVPSDFYAKRSAYFDNLKASGVKMDDNAGTAQKPQMPDSMVAWQGWYHTLPQGTGARSAALRSPEGVAYIKYLDDNKLFNNQERADLGLPPLADTSGQYSSGSRYNSNGSAGANPYKYAVSRDAGGTPRKGTISVKAPAQRASVKSSRSYTAPKITMKKSKV